jgi:hypothetical protein
MWSGREDQTRLPHLEASMASSMVSPRRRGGQDWISDIARRVGKNYWLLAACAFSGALALFTFYNTWRGMRGYAGGPVGTFLGSLGVQGLVCIFAWLLAFAIVRGQKPRIFSFAAGYLISVWASILFCFAALYFNMSTPQSLQEGADLAARSVGRQVADQLDRKLTAEQDLRARILKEAVQYWHWSDRVDQIIADSSLSEARLNGQLATEATALAAAIEKEKVEQAAAEGELSGARSELDAATAQVVQLEGEISALAPQKQAVDARIASWDGQIDAQNKLIEKEIQGDGTVNTGTVGKAGCGDVCRSLQADLNKLIVARTPDLSQQTTLAKQLGDLDASRKEATSKRDHARQRTSAASQQLVAVRARLAGDVATSEAPGGGSVRLEQLQSNLRDARDSFNKTSDPAQLNAALAFCRRIQQVMRDAASVGTTGDACVLMGLDHEREQLDRIAAAHSGLESACSSGDPFQSIDYAAAMTLGERCVNIVQPSGISVLPQQRLLQQGRQDYSYAAQLRHDGVLITSLAELGGVNKVEIASSGLRSGEWKARIAAALAATFDLLIFAVAWGGAIADSVSGRGSESDEEESLGMHVNAGDEPHIRALKLMVQAVVTERGEQILEIYEPCRHSDPNIKVIANTLVAKKQLLPPRRGGRYYRFAPGGYEKLKTVLRRALSAPTITVLPAPHGRRPVRTGEVYEGQRVLPAPHGSSRASSMAGED